ncbi:MAG: twin-arginine translocation signal domain-containing protein, partial [Deltaproteobacteria bacterium]|nr:twin-arginine translocation signal domain-containing protein [Deltaproteobacteria bacterium]
MRTLEHLEKLLTEGKINRRQFLARAAALGLTAAVSPALLAGEAKAAAPKKGGHFTFALTGGSTTDTLDPATHTSSWNINAEFQLRNCLVEIDHNFGTMPELAESWESSPDAKKWIFNLRKGVEFHDGKTLEAEDVIYSLRHHMGPDSKSAAKPYLDPITSIKADGKHQVVIE